ncbi:MAG: hypothetical protein BWX88_02332 [Planctomycetes bacterium ADurb.Bin126]|nr:MAG: hypothetical protein BWX88_02332 [Planctomycetes bacterium ADurb.Bin126]HOD84130.1 hypothetical protein [Phycisphaerae bacterium]HQL76540.1 hypothetical protein [Phycisphaerae bacterium]
MRLLYFGFTLGVFALLLLWSSSQDLPSRSDFVRVATLALSVLGVLLATISWRLRSRRQRKMERETNPQSAPGRGFRFIIRELVVYVLALAIGSVAFWMYMETNPMPRFVTQELIESEYAAPVDYLTSFAKALRRDARFGPPLDRSCLSSRPEILSAHALLLVDKHVVGPASSYEGRTIVSSYSEGYPYDAEGRPAPLMFVACTDSSGVTLNAIEYRWTVRNNEGYSVECGLLIELEALRAAAQRHTASQPATRPAQ